MPLARTDIGIGWRHPHYRTLLESLPPLDFLEVHSENFFAEGGAALAVLMQGRAHYAISLHGVGLSLGSAAGVDNWHLEQLAYLIEQVDPVRISDHASFARGLWRSDMVHASDLLPIPFNEQALDVLSANVQYAQRQLGRPLLLENLSAYLQWKVRGDEHWWSEPEFLNTVAQRTGCGLLIDVNNIYVNARNAALRGACGDPLRDCMHWLDAIAPHAVGEIHLAGHCHVTEEDGEIYIDDHGRRVDASVWQLYAHAIRRFGPVPTLVEWDTDLPALSVLLDEAAQARHIQQAICLECA